MSSTSLPLIPVIMAGGSGTRLWPMSRESFPKQFLSLNQPESLLQVTIQRLKGLVHGEPLVICNEAHRFLVADQMQQIGVLNRNILLEPFGRNTAPAIAMAAIASLKDGQDPLLLVLAADHAIADAAAFRAAVERAAPLAQDGAMVTFGIVAHAPETGYGYIRRGAAVADNIYSVAAFVEKPDRATAEGYVASGDYDWNSGMFLFKASRVVEELRQHRPDILAACEAAMANLAPDLDFIRINKDAFAACPSDSIDYAVMEKTQRAVVVPLDAGWSDIGAFGALWDLLPKDADGNAHRGDVIAVDSRNNLIMAEDALVATVGVSDMVVVQTKDAILVAPRDRAQDVKSVVNTLKAQGRDEHLVHKEVFRPWGKYQSVDDGARYQVKRITVKPGAKLSVQMHHHRAEHWIVVTGTAKVTLDGTDHLLTENQSIYLPLGAVHALYNPGKIPLELIEVQVGSYLGEDDIVRFEDLYGRVDK